MRVLFCNKYNFPFSGTEVYLFELMELLRSRGHEVALFSMADPRGESTSYDHHFVPHVEFKTPSGSWAKMWQAAHAIYSTDARRRLRAMIRDFRPDVAHVRNIYHHLSPSILWELRAQRVPVLYHINDFKLLCPSYNLVSQGEACEACKRGAFWHALRAPCYPGLGARTTLAAEALTHRWLGTYRKCVDLFLGPSQFVRDKFVEHGWDNTKFQVLPHFQKLPEIAPSKGSDNRQILYVGRLSAEKGIEDLVRAMAQVADMQLVIAGDGPKKSDLQKLSDDLELPNIEFTGQVSFSKRDALIARSRFTVMPSHAYETFGKTILESYALGRAVVASDTGSRRELVHQGETGLLYRCGNVDELAQSIRLLASSPELAEKMGRAGQALVREKYSPDSHFQNLMTLYEGLIARKAGQRSQIALSFREDSSAKFSRRLLHLRAKKSDSGDRPKLRIAFIGGRGVISKYSGIEAYYEEVGSRLAEMGHEVTVYCRNYFTPALREYNGMRLVRLPTFRTKHLETLVHTFLSTAHALTQRFDLIHFHALGPVLFSIIPRGVGIKTAVTVQGLDWQRQKWGRVASTVLRMGEVASVRLPSATMVVSRSLEDSPRSARGANILRAKRWGAQATKPTEQDFGVGVGAGEYVLFLGRFSPEKGCHLLIEVFEQLETDVKLVMAGAASYCDEYSRKLREHASDKLRMLDWVSGDTLDELLTNSMIFVLPSDMEGLSLALLDAMGASLCVLTSDVPENREVVEGAGFTFRQGSASDLAERLRFLIANPALREAAGRTARKRIEDQYQWQDR